MSAEDTFEQKMRAALEQAAFEAAEAAAAKRREEEEKKNGEQ